MRVVCRHGHFAFYPKRVSDIARFCYQYNTVLIREEDYYTFPELQGLENYSLEGKSFLNLPALVTFQGKNPWDVMKANGFVFHIASQILLPKSAIAIPIRCPLTGYFFVSPSPLIQPGSRNEAGIQILSYDGEYMENLIQLRISEFRNE
jgi:hypothetical protein